MFVAEIVALHLARADKKLIHWKQLFEMCYTHTLQDVV